MPASPIPAPLPPWARWLIQLAPLISTGLQAALEYIGDMESGTAPVPDEWRRFVMSFELAGNINPKDIYSTSIDIVNVTNGGVDNSWTDADHDLCATALHTFIGNVLLTYCPTELHHKRTDAYRMQFAPVVADPPAGEPIQSPFLKSGPPVKTYGTAGVGAGGAAMQVPQVAMTTTDRTPYPRHWGRNYWPLPAPPNISGDGHLASAMVDGLGTGLHQCYQSLQDQEMFPVVVVTRAEKQPIRGLLGITEIQVDNVPDIIRRRRPSVATHYYRSPTAREQPAWPPPSSARAA